MKIVCDSCGAKYSIADEKVAGKVFKIRCKKCSAVIVVKGDQEESDEATRVYDYGSEAVWHVVVGGDQQGPVTPRQIGEMLAEGAIDWEAYVWREGMDGWQPAKDVEPLVNAIMAESDGAAGPEAVRASGAQDFAGSADMGADPFAGGDDGGLSGVLGQSSAASAAAAGGTADLFAQSASSPFAGSDEAPTVGPGNSPRVSESEAMTGQRNENSVLFSLSNLQALATGSGSAPASTRPKPGMAQGEGSGLIDIRALAAATQTVASAPSNGSSRDKVEDLLAVGAAGTGFSATTFAAPVAAEKADNSKIMLGGMAAAILLLGAAVGYLALREPEVPQAVLAAQGPEAAGQAPTAASAPAAQAAAMPTGQAEQQGAEPAPAAKPSAKADDDDNHDKSESSRSERKARRSSDSSSSGSSSKAEKEPSAAAPAPAPKASSNSNSADKSIDDLLGAALGGGKPAKSAPKPAANLPSSPGRDDVLSAMKSVTSRVQACGGGQSGIATSKVTVTGATGRVTRVDVSGQFAGTPVASCIVREVSKARFPKFSQSTFSFSYPFKI